MSNYSLDELLERIRAAVGSGDSETASVRYQQALNRAQEIVGEGEATPLLLLMCICKFYEQSGRSQQASMFHRLARDLVRANGGSVEGCPRPLSAPLVTGDKCVAMRSH